MLFGLNKELKFNCPFGFQTTHLSRQYLGTKWGDYFFKHAGYKKMGSCIYLNAFHKLKLVYSWSVTYSSMEHQFERFRSAQLSPASNISHWHYCEKTIVSLMVYALNTLRKENKSKSLTEKVYNWRCQTTDKQKPGTVQGKHDTALVSSLVSGLSTSAAEHLPGEV